MGGLRKKPAYGMAIYATVILSLATYFTFASVQGDYGLFQRVQIDAEADALRRERDHLRQQVAQVRNKTHRLSDEFLDLDLLDEQARDMLGMVRSDDLVIR